MSFRELRNFCEILRALGYQRLVSMENFRSPNFELVADICDWLLHRFEPNCAIPDDISTESRRVEFIKAVCEKVVLRTGVKLNARKLYGADGYAVKEMLRLANILYEAQKSVGDIPADTSDDFTLNSKLSDLKSTRSLCSQIVESGASLFELLQKEGDVRQEREKALNFLDGMSRNLGSNSETDAIERLLSSQLGSQNQNLEQLKQMSEELQRDEKQLEQKIRKKRQELDRSNKRLGSLASVRPAFMDEFEQLEQELERYYEQYVGRFRNLDYLEHEMDALNREEMDRMEANERALKKMQQRLRDEEWRLLRGEEDGKSKNKAKKNVGAKRWMPPSAVAVDGSMDAPDDDDEDSASESDSDQPISVGGSEDSGSDVGLGGGRDFGGGRGGGGGGGGGRDFGGGRGQHGGLGGEAPVSIGGSVSDDDILNESDDDGDSGSDERFMGGPGRPQGGSDFDF